MKQKSYPKYGRFPDNGHGIVPDSGSQFDIHDQKFNRSYKALFILIGVAVILSFGVLVMTVLITLK